MTGRLEQVQRSPWPGAPAAPAWRLQAEGIRVVVSALGAHVLDVCVPDAEGWRRISVDYPQVPNPRGFHGATAGRWANRIAGAAFTLDGERIRLEPNEGPNQLHGGPDGFNRRVWNLRRLVEAADGGVGVELGLVSPDGDQGFPGVLEATARVTVGPQRLAITYQAVSDRPTVVNLTNHLYWNLAGPGSLDGHRLTIGADRYVAVDGGNIPVPGPPQPVAGTRFDCRAGRDLAGVIADGGFDHCFLVDGRIDEACVRLDHVSGRRLEIATDQIGCQVYTGRHLDPDRAGIALETQRIPDSPNRPDLGPSVLRPGERYHSHTEVWFGG